MHIDINDILSYIKCPKEYQLSKECKISDTTYSSIDEKYISELKRAIYFLFNIIQSEGTINFGNVKTAWGNLWVGKRRKQDILIPVEDPVRIWYRKRERDGIDSLFNVYNYYAGGDYTVVAVNLDGKMTFSGTHSISATIPLIISDDDKIKIIDFRLFDGEISIKRDLVLTIYSMLFRRLFNTKEASVGIFYTDKKKYVESTRTEKDYKILTATYADIIKGIKSGVYFRAISKRCDSCPYSYYCKEV